MAVHKCCTFLLKRKNLLSPTPDACCALLALRSIQLMTDEPRPPVQRAPVTWREWGLCSRWISPCLWVFLPWQLSWLKSLCFYGNFCGLIHSFWLCWFHCILQEFIIQSFDELGLSQPMPDTAGGRWQCTPCHFLDHSTQFWKWYWLLPCVMVNLSQVYISFIM